MNQVQAELGISPDELLHKLNKKKYKNTKVSRYTTEPRYVCKTSRFVVEQEDLIPEGEVRQESFPYPYRYNFKEVEGKSGKLYMAGQGDNEADILVLMGAPSLSMAVANDYLESPNEEIFKGKDIGDELYHCLKKAGIDPETGCFITCAQRFYLPKGKPSKEENIVSKELLIGDILQVKPKVIIAMGAAAYKVLVGKNQASSDLVGQFIEYEIGDFKCDVMVTHAIGTVAAVDPLIRNDFIFHLELAKRHSVSPICWDKFDAITIDSPEVSKSIVDYYLNQFGNDLFYIGYDLEWKGDKFNYDEVCYTFQYSCEKGKAIILKLTNDGKTENIELLNTIKPLLEHPNARRCGWNIRADDKRLVFRGIKIPENTVAFDGMKAVAFIDSRLGKGLETGVMYFTNYGPYYTALNLALKKHKLKHGSLCDLMWLEPEIFFSYCAGDAVSHREACLNMMKALPAEFNHLYYDIYLPFGNYLLDMEITGLPVDTNTLEDMTKMYNDKYTEIKAKFLKMLCHEKIGMGDMNPNSSPAKAILLYEKLKLEPMYYTFNKKIRPRAWYLKQSRSKKEDCKPSTNNKSLSAMLYNMKKKSEDKQDDWDRYRYDVVECLLQLNRINVFSNKFLSKRGVEVSELLENEEDIEELEDDEEAVITISGKPLKQSYWASISPNTGAIHANFYETLDTFRCASNPNIQNVGGKAVAPIPDIFFPGYSKLNKDDQKLHKDKVPKNIRTAFSADITKNPFLDPVSRDPKDWLFSEVDIAGADLAIQAFVSNDPDFMRDMRKGGFHETKMRQYFKDNSLTKKNVDKYTAGKACSFRCSYTADLQSAAEPLAADLYAEAGIEMPVNDLKYALSTWENYRSYMAFRKKCTDRVEHSKYAQSPYGPLLLFEESRDPGQLSSWKNAALAFEISSCLSWYLMDVGCALKKYLLAEKLWMRYVFPINSIHDALYHSVHKDLQKDNYWSEVCKYYFCEATKLPNGISLGMEMALSDVWKGKEVFGAETKWDFDLNTWVWKK